MDKLLLMYCMHMFVQSLHRGPTDYQVYYSSSPPPLFFQFSGHCPTTHPLDTLQPPASRTFGQPSSNGDRPAVRNSLPEGGGAKMSCFAARSRATMARGNNSSASALDTFMMLRSVRVSAGGKKRVPEEDSTGTESNNGVYICV